MLKLPANRLPFGRQEKSRNDECLKVSCASQLTKLSIIKTNLCPSWLEEALN